MFHIPLLLADQEPFRVGLSAPAQLPFLLASAMNVPMALCEGFSLSRSDIVDGLATHTSCLVRTGGSWIVPNFFDDQLPSRNTVIESHAVELESHFPETDPS